MAGISKLIGMGLTSIFSGGSEGGDPGGIMGEMRKQSGLLDGAGNGGLMSAIRRPAKMSGRSLLDGAGDEPAYSPLKNITGIGF